MDAGLIIFSYGRGCHTHCGTIARLSSRRAVAWMAFIAVGAANRTMEGNVRSVSGGYGDSAQAVELETVERFLKKLLDSDKNIQNSDSKQ